MGERWREMQVWEHEAAVGWVGGGMDEENNESDRYLDKT